MELCRTPLQIICILAATALLLQLSNAQNSKQDYLNAHNSARAQVSVEPLIWDEKVAAYAQNFAEKRARNCTLIYSGGPYGENLESSSGDLSGKDAVMLWVSQKSKYDYASNSCASGSLCDHYTQVVWKNTTRLGCARVHCNNGGTFVICNYDPPVNVVGERRYLIHSKSNVLPPQVPPTGPPVLPPQVPPTGPPGNQSKRKGFVILGAVIIFTWLALVCFICYKSAKACYICYSFWKRCWFKGRRESNNDYTNPETQQLIRELKAKIASVDEHNGMHKLILNGEHDQELPLFNFSSIEAATRHFSDANKLGRGGFGPVYKGILAGGQEIAVKRLCARSSQGLKEFVTEVMLISKVQHRNLVRLLGCCINDQEKILVYEYLPNKSLDSFLYDTTKRLSLDWTKRTNIVQGIAQGLLYLHKYSRLRIIHRDLKTSNILLNSKMEPKISDFGTAKIFEDSETQANTDRIIGTYGYMSPEYAMEGIFSEKSDVFSFGVMMLEIITGKRNIDFYHSHLHSNLIRYAWNLWKEGRGVELMDPSLEETCSTSELFQYVQIALLCVQDCAADRPNMSDVISMFGTDVSSLPHPRQPTFSTVARPTNVSSLLDPKPNNNGLDENTGVCSKNYVTISCMQAR